MSDSDEEIKKTGGIAKLIRQISRGSGKKKKGSDDSRILHRSRSHDEPVRW